MAIAAGRLGLWALEPTGLARLDPASLRVLDRAPLAGASLDRLAVGTESVWVTDSARASLARRSRRCPRGRAHDRPRPGIDAVAVAGGSVWVANPERRQLVRIDPRRNAVVERIPLPGPPLGVLAAGRRVWVTVGARRRLPVMRWGARAAP